MITFQPSMCHTTFYMLLTKKRKQNKMENRERGTRGFTIEKERVFGDRREAARGATFALYESWEHAGKRSRSWHSERRCPGSILTRYSPRRRVIIQLTVGIPTMGLDKISNISKKGPSECQREFKEGTRGRAPDFRYRKRTEHWSRSLGRSIREFVRVWDRRPTDSTYRCHYRDSFSSSSRPSQVQFFDSSGFCDVARPFVVSFFRER